MRNAHACSETNRPYTEYLKQDTTAVGKYMQFIYLFLYLFTDSFAYLIDYLFVYLFCLFLCLFIYLFNITHKGR